MAIKADVTVTVTQPDHYSDEELHIGNVSDSPELVAIWITNDGRHVATAHVDPDEFNHAWEIYRAGRYAQ